MSLSGPSLLAGEMGGSAPDSLLIFFPIAEEIASEFQVLRVERANEPPGPRGISLCSLDVFSQRERGKYLLGELFASVGTVQVDCIVFLVKSLFSVPVSHLCLFLGREK